MNRISYGLLTILGVMFCASAVFADESDDFGDTTASAAQLPLPPIPPANAPSMGGGGGAVQGYVDSGTWDTAEQKPAVDLNVDTAKWNTMSDTDKTAYINAANLQLNQVASGSVGKINADGSAIIPPATAETNAQGAAAPTDQPGFFARAWNWIKDQVGGIGSYIANMFGSGDSKTAVAAAAPPTNLAPQAVDLSALIAQNRASTAAGQQIPDGQMSPQAVQALCQQTGNCPPGPAGTVVANPPMYNGAGGASQ